MRKWKPGNTKGFGLKTCLWGGNISAHIISDSIELICQHGSYHYAEKSPEDMFKWIHLHSVTIRLYCVARREYQMPITLEDFQGLGESWRYPGS